MTLGAASFCASFCVEGATLRASPARFAWQAQHLEHLRFVLRGRRSNWSTFIEVSGSPATSDDFGGRGSKRSTWSWSTSGSICVAGAALGAPQARFPWQAQHLEHLHRGRQKSGHSVANGRRLLLRGRRSTWSTSGWFCVAGAELAAPPCHFAWHVQHSEHLHRGQRKSGDEWWLWAPRRFAWKAQHFEHLQPFLRGRCSTCSTSVSFCVAHAALGAPS